ncbi:hypothetical protein MUP01_06785 [Candidatus Bathyarchaeota archaeon]|nr:hypothetical protein [Candidatus Bathyarchaeota archaeon]
MTKYEMISFSMSMQSPDEPFCRLVAFALFHDLRINARKIVESVPINRVLRATLSNFIGTGASKQKLDPLG